MHVPKTSLHPLPIPQHCPPVRGERNKLEEMELEHEKENTGEPRRKTLGTQKKKQRGEVNEERSTPSAPGAC